MNIIFKELEVQNFKSIGKAITLNYTDFSGLNFIIGTNLDQPGSKNGSGKSALAVDALVFALFGKTLKNTNNAYIANRSCDKKLETYAKLLFSVDNINYRSESYIKNSTTVKMCLYKENENEEDGWEDLTQCSVLKTRQYIQDNILNCTFDIFKTAIIIAAADYLNFYEGMNKAQKRQYIENIFNLSCFGEMYALVKSDMNDTKKEITYSNNEIISITNYLTDLNNKSEDFNKNLSSVLDNIKLKLKEKADNYKSIKTKIEQDLDLYTSFNNIDNELKDLNKNLKDYTNKHSKIEKDILSIKYKIETINNSIEEYNRLKSTVYNIDLTGYKQNIDNLNNEIKEITKNIELYETKINKFGNITQNIKNIKNNISELTISISKLDKEIIKANCKIDSISSSKSEIDDIKVLLCNDCKEKINTKYDYEKKEKSILALQKYIEEHNKQKEEFQLQIETLNKNIIDEENKLSEKQDLISELNNIKTSLKFKEKELSKAVLEYDKNKENIQKIKKNFDVDKKQADIEQLNNNLKEKDNEKLLLIEQINNITEKINELNEQVIQKNNLLNSINLMKADLKHKKSEILSLKEEFNNTQLKSVNNPFSELIENTNVKLNNEKIRSANLIKNYQHMEILKDVYSENGVKRHIIKNIISLLNSLIQKYLSEIGAEFLVCFDETFDFKFLTLNGECEYSNFSAGEKQRIQIATMLAFRDIILNGKINSNILIIDEMLDQAIDSIAIKKITNILQRKSVESNQTTFVISHRSEITEDNIFNNIIEVVKENGISSINII